MFFSQQVQFCSHSSKMVAFQATTQWWIFFHRLYHTCTIQNQLRTILYQLLLCRAKNLYNFTGLHVEAPTRSSPTQQPQWGKSSIFEPSESTLLSLTKMSWTQQAVDQISGRNMILKESLCQIHSWKLTHFQDKLRQATQVCNLTETARRSWWKLKSLQAFVSLIE